MKHNQVPRAAQDTSWKAIRKLGLKKKAIFNIPVSKTVQRCGIACEVQEASALQVKPGAMP